MNDPPGWLVRDSAGTARCRPTILARRSGARHAHPTPHSGTENCARSADSKPHQVFVSGLPLSRTQPGGGPRQPTTSVAGGTLLATTEGL